MKELSEFKNYALGFGVDKKKKKEIATRFEPLEVLVLIFFF